MNARLVIFAKVVAIFLQLATAKSSGLSYQISQANLTAFNGTSKMSSVLRLGGHAAMKGKESIVFIETKGQNLVSEVNGMCRYPAKTFAHGTDEAPVMAFLEDNCTIRNAPLDSATYPKSQAYKIFYDGGSITYISSGEIVVGKATISYFYKVIIASLGFTVPDAELSTYNGTSNLSSVWVMEGRDSISGYLKSATIFMENKGNSTVKVVDGKCRYTAYIFAYGEHESPVLGHLEDKCNIKDAPLDPTSYITGQARQIFFEGGTINFTFVNVVFKGSITIFHRLVLPKYVLSYTAYHADLTTFNGTSEMSSVLGLGGYAAMKGRDSVVFIETKGKHLVSEVNGTCRYPAKTFAYGTDKAPVLSFLEDNCTIRNAPLDSATYPRNQTYKISFDGGSITYISSGDIEVGQAGISYFYNVVIASLGYTIPDAELSTYKGTSNRSSVWVMEGRDYISGKIKSASVFMENKGNFTVKQVDGKCRYTAYVFAYGEHVSPVLGYLEEKCNIKDAPLDPTSFTTGQANKIFFEGGTIVFTLMDVSFRGDITTFDKVILPKYVFSYTVSEASVEAYSAINDGSTVLNLIGFDDTSEMKKDSFVYTDENGRYPVKVLSPSRCKYTARVYAHGEFALPEWGYLEDNCTIRNYPLSKATYPRGKIYKIFFERGSITYISLGTIRVYNSHGA